MTRCIRKRRQSVADVASPLSRSSRTLPRRVALRARPVSIALKEALRDGRGGAWRRGRFPRIEAGAEAESAARVAVFLNLTTLLEINP
jgi:hypothetical protein